MILKHLKFDASSSRDRTSEVLGFLLVERAKILQAADLDLEVVN